MSEDLHLWGERLRAAVAAGGVTCIDRVVVVPEAASTQDVAREMAAKRPGLLVLAGRQTAGRGRLGRKWMDEGGQGLAATFALGGVHGGPGGLSIAAGLAACRTVEAALSIKKPPVLREVVLGLLDGLFRGDSLLFPHDPMTLGPPLRIGLRWPNDVVEVPPAGRDRKIAGVLVEVGSGVALVGVGINVLQMPADFPPEIRSGSASVSLLGSSWSRIEVAERLVLEMDRALKLGPDDLIRQWQERDVLIGTRRTFEHAGEQYYGIVEAIKPTSEIQIRVDGARIVHLPAMTTSLVPDA